MRGARAHHLRAMTRSRTPTPRQLCTLAARRLAAMGDPVRADGARAYFKKFEPIVLYGVAVPEGRRLARELHASVKDAWEVDDAIRFCDRCVRRPHTELKWIGFFVLGRFAKDFPRSLLGAVKRWVSAGPCNNWALVDALSPALVTPLLERYPDLVPVLTGWATSANLWVRRTAVVPFVPLARKGRELDAAYAVAVSLFADREDLIHKACGWLLREAGKTDMARLERFLLAHGPRIPRTTLRYAIERMPLAQRTRVLAQTRPASRASRAREAAPRS